MAKTSNRFDGGEYVCKYLRTHRTTEKGHRVDITGTARKIYQHEAKKARRRTSIKIINQELVMVEGTYTEGQFHAEHNALEEMSNDLYAAMVLDYSCDDLDMWEPYENFDPEPVLADWIDWDWE